MRSPEEHRASGERVRNGQDNEAAWDELLQLDAPEPPPAGFVHATMRRVRADGRPSFRALDLVWPLAAASVAIVPLLWVHLADRLRWLELAQIWAMEAWIAWTALPPPPAPIAATTLAAVMVVLAWVIDGSFLEPVRFGSVGAAPLPERRRWGA